MVEEVPRVWFAFFWIVWALCASHAVVTLLMNTGYYSTLWSRASLRAFGWGFSPDLIARRGSLSCMASLTVAATSVSLAVAARASGLPNPQRDFEFFAGIAIAALSLFEAFWALFEAFWAPFEAFWALRRVPKSLIAAGLATGALMISAWVVLAGSLDLLKNGREGHALAFAGYRAVHLESGTSPVLPLVILLAALYLYFWFGQTQLRLAEDRPATFPKLSSDCTDKDIIDAERVLPEIGWPQLATVGAVIFCWFLFLKPLQALSTLEHLPLYGGILIVLSTSVIALLALAAFRFVALWKRLRQLLSQLERSPLRFAFERLPKDFSWMSVWTGDPRPKLLMPMRALEVLRLIPADAGNIAAVEKELNFLSDRQRSFRAVYQHVASLNKALDEAAVLIAKDLEQVWKKGTSDTMWSLEKKEPPPAGFSSDKHKQIVDEEFLALRFISFIRYSLWIMRTFLGFLTYGFILLVAGLTLYPFEGGHEIGVALVIVFIVIGGFVFSVFAQMDRDPLLSRLSETKPNELSWNFLYRAISFAALPLLTLLASQVPEVGNFLLSWLQPALTAAR
jgi:hypothetical protein